MSRAQEPLPQPAHMFGDQSKSFITGGTFIIQTRSSSQSQRDRAIGFDVLQKQVVLSACHDSSQRLDPPKCHPNTREAALERIFEWIVKSEERKEWIFWLNGAAGAGKSSILQSIAERCAKAGIPLASFFLFRTDPERNTLERLVGTIVYQLINAIPEVKDDILEIIGREPLIFQKSIEFQLDRLVVQPLLGVPHLIERLLFAILIDGLDECLTREAQSAMINVFGNILANNSPVIFLIASRREPHLEMAFKQNFHGEILSTLPLDDDVQKVSNDIRRFLEDKFSDIKKNHPFHYLLHESWPKVATIEKVVEKSSGQFIYASVVIGFVSSPYANPATRLDMIKFDGPSDGDPFANLDTLYQYIFSQVKALDKVLNILAYVLLQGVTDIPEIEGIFGYEVEIVLADLRSVIVCRRPDSPKVKIEFLHASLPDFLLDKSRSGMYHISSDVYTPRLLCVLLKTPTCRWTFYGRYRPILRLLKKAKPSEELRLALMNFTEEVYDDGRDRTGAMSRTEFLKHLGRLNFKDGGAVRRHFLEIFGPKIAEEATRVRVQKQWSPPEGKIRGIIRNLFVR